MYSLSNLLEFKKEPSEIVNKYSIHSLSDNGFKDYTDLDSYMCHKYITARKLDYLNPDYLKIRQNTKNTQLTQTHNENNSDDNKLNQLDNKVEIKDENTPNEEPPKEEKIKINQIKTKAPFQLSKRLYDINRIKANLTIDNTAETKTKITSLKNFKDSFSYKNVPKIASYSTQKSNNIYFNNINQNIKNTLYACCGSQDLENNSRFKTLETEMSNTLDKNFNNSHLQSLKLPNIKNFKLIKVNENKNTKNKNYLGDSYDPSNYLIPDFHKKKLL